MLGKKATHGECGLASWRQRVPAEGSVSGVCLLCLPRRFALHGFAVVYVFVPLIAPSSFTDTWTRILFKFYVHGFLFFDNTFF